MSSIKNFYKGKCILVTGATGFLGHVLVEKLLRSFPDLGKLYLLTRAKNGSNFTDRTNAYFTDPLFERMITENPNYSEKVQWIECDLSKERLGLAPEDLQQITKTVNLIFHVAACVKLANDLHAMLNNNLKATLELLKIAKQTDNLECFLNVSTAFSYARKSCKRIEEILYPPPIEPDKLLQLLNILPQNTLNDITPHIILDWPNTYAYAKHASEYMCNDYINDFPVCIIRPGNITSTFQEPIPFWARSKAGIMGGIIGIMSKAIRVILFSKNVQCHVVPVDIVANGTLASAYTVAKERPKEIAIYNVTSNNNPVTCRDIVNFSFEKPNFLLVNCSSIIFTIFHFLLHALPAYLLDFWLLICGKKTKFRAMYGQMNRYLKVTDYFRFHEFQIDNNKLENLWSSFTGEEKELLPFDMRDIDWRKYFRNLPAGIEKYIFKYKSNKLSISS